MIIVTQQLAERRQLAVSQALTFQLSVSCRCSWLSLALLSRIAAKQHIKWKCHSRFRGHKEVWRERERYEASVHRAECVSDMVCDEGHRTNHCSWIRHELKGPLGRPLSICHLHAWPKPWWMTGEGMLYGVALGASYRVHKRDCIVQLCYL